MCLNDAQQRWLLYSHYGAELTLKKHIYIHTAAYSRFSVGSKEGNSYALGLFQTRQVQPSLIVHLLERSRDVQAAQIQNNTNRIRHTFLIRTGMSRLKNTHGNKKTMSIDTREQCVQT